ncbi:MAG: signal peptidase I [Clostridia bacterium]|nr:signal peptidase I [Clostridia bacterium]
MEIEDKKTQDKAKALKIVNITLVVIIVILAFILISMTFLWTPMTVVGPSMNNTLHDGEKIILLTALYKYTYGDIIVFEKIENEKNVIKRVIGLPGDRLRYDIIEKAWYRNGEKLEEEYVLEDYLSTYLDSSRAAIKVQLISSEGYLVEEDKVFVLGDNRNVSNDSHIYGSIDKSQILGKYLFGY